MAVKAVSTVRTTDAKRDDSAAEQLQQATGHMIFTLLYLYPNPKLG
jgi:hypothetical protein